MKKVIREVRRTPRALARLAIAVPVVFALPAVAATLNVPQAYPNIQAAINAAQAGDTVLVAPGVYTGAGNRDITPMGKAITIRSAGGAATCTISIGARNEYHTGFAVMSSETAATVIDGFTITGGYEFNGGGLWASNASPTIRNCVFTGNTVDCWGGAVYFEGNCNPRMTNCLIYGNYSSDEGGGVFVISTNATVENCVIRDNQAAAGGGVCVLTGQAQFVNCSITGNNADYYGGGAYMWGGRLTNCTVVGNSAAFQGDGLYIGAGATVTNSIVWANTGTVTQIANANTNQTGVSFSIVQGGSTGLNVSSADPRFMNAAGGDFRLTPRSPGIDAGLNGAVPAGVTTDLAGAPRIMGSASGGVVPATVDIGAYEAKAVSTLTIK
jgi:hypothetical protein